MDTFKEFVKLERDEKWTDERVGQYQEAEFRRGYAKAVLELIDALKPALSPEQRSELFRWRSQIEDWQARYRGEFEYAPPPPYFA